MLQRTAVVGAALALVVAFFLPWMEGSSELAQRSFSGFDFARLVRNFEITARSTSDLGQIRVAALVIYLVPALAINGVVLRTVGDGFGLSRSVSRGAVVAAGAYSLLILTAVLFLSLVPLNEFADVVGPPRYGFGICALASVLLVLLGGAELRTARGVTAG